MRIIVVGASGLLGSNVAATAQARGFDVLGTYHTTPPRIDIESLKCDITDGGAVHSLVKEYDPDWLINCAAMTDVDACEQHPRKARALNADAPGKLATICTQAQCRVLQVSTDYVFGGDATTPYESTDEREPIQQYGHTKRSGEDAVQSATSDAIIVRLSFLYGVHQSSGELTGFPAWVASELSAGNDIPLFTDQYVSPTRAGQAAETLLDLIAADTVGVYHVACRDCTTPYQLGRRIADRIDAAGSISEGRQSDLDRPAQRPRYSCLDVRGTETTLGRPQPTLSTDLDAVRLG